MLVSISRLMLLDPLLMKPVRYPRAEEGGLEIPSKTRPFHVGRIRHRDVLEVAAMVRIGNVDTMEHDP